MSITGGLIHAEVELRDFVAARRHATADWIVRHLWGAGLAFSIVVWGILATVILVR
jgi:hypothetical protein